MLVSSRYSKFNKDGIFTHIFYDIVDEIFYKEGVNA